MFGRSFFIAAIILVSAIHTVRADDWTGLQNETLVTTQTGGCCATPLLPGTALNPATTYVQVNSITNGILNVQTGEISITDFARSSTVASLQSTVNQQSSTVASLQSTVNQQLAVINQQIGATQGMLLRRTAALSAMAAVMGNISPADGNSNRIGFDMDTVLGHSAFGANYIHVAGPLDFHGSAAYASGGGLMGKLGAGYSW